MIECNAHRWSSRICSWGRRNRLLPRGDVYRQQGCAVGFGEATHQMRAALRDNGLELAQAGRQYEDHMGIELLLASELCRRAGEGEDWGADAGCVPSAASEGADANTQNALSAARSILSTSCAPARFPGCQPCAKR